MELDDGRRGFHRDVMMLDACEKLITIMSNFEILRSVYYVYLSTV